MEENPPAPEVKEESKCSGFLKKSATIPLYGGRLSIVICDKISDVEGKQASDWKACCEQDGMMTIMTFERANLGHGIIAHEARHATDNIMKRVGSRPCEANKEPYAYLQQWVVAWVGQALDRLKIEINRF